MSSKTVRKIIYDGVKFGGYDGLYNLDLCACELSDLLPCDNVELDCRAGYKIVDNLKCDCGFHICGSKDVDDNYECEL